jgi:PAS domain S-box-containing protein
MSRTRVLAEPEYSVAGRTHLAAIAGGVATFTLDLGANRWEWDTGARSLFGLAAPDPWPDPWTQVIVPDDAPKLHAAVHAAAEAGTCAVEFRIAHPDGGTRWFALKGTTAGQPPLLRGACFEITSWRAPTARWQAQNAAQQERNATLRQRVVERGQALAVSNAQLEESERRFGLLIEAVTDYAIFMLDPDGVVASWNRGAERIKGYAPQEIIGRHFSTFYTDTDRIRNVPGVALETARRVGRYEAEGWRLRQDGSRFWASVVVSAMRDADGVLLGFGKVTRDLTERRATEERLRQAQKMEAIGQLTGGIAHDFNNLLTVIGGDVETLRRRLPATADPALHRLASSALRGAERATILTHRLLAFARRQPLEPRPVVVNTAITGLSEMLRRTLPEDIAIETVLTGGVWTVFADPTELENSLLNLAVNARDAMPDGGKLTIESANVTLDDADAATAEVPPGQYAGIFVGDTGSGMAPDIVARVFEPFFTTKETGQGTGLGLSQVYGFIRQSGGHVRVYSEVGAGTTVKLYLPRHIPPAAAAAASAPAVAAPPGGNETLLVVEDDPDVRAFAVEVLEDLGYRVAAAADGAAGLRLLDATPDVALLFTDVGLPGGMNGRQLADAARQRRPTLKVLFTSGYARDAIVHHGRLDPGVELLAKPFSFATLAARVRRMLDGE